MKTISPIKRHLLIFLFMILGAIPAFADPEHPATLEELNGMVKVQNCSGSLVSLGRKDTVRGLILAAGHCPSYPRLYKPGQAEGGTDFSKEKPANLFPPGSSLTEPKKQPLGNLYYGTMSNVDLALYEIPTSIEKLRDQKLKILELADYLPQPGLSYQITSGYWRETQTCEVESILDDNKAEEAAVGQDLKTYQFRNSILFKTPCFSRGGWSGSPVVDAESGLIYGVISRIYEVNKTLKLSQFAEFISKKWNPFNPEISAEVRVIASNVLDLKDCLTSEGAINTGQPNCSLPKPNIIPSPTARPSAKPRNTPLESPKKPTSSWPKISRSERH